MSGWTDGLAHLDAAYRHDEADMEAEQEARWADHATRRAPRPAWTPRPDDQPWTDRPAPPWDTEQDARDEQAWADHDARADQLRDMWQDGEL